MKRKLLALVLASTLCGCANAKANELPLPKADDSTFSIDQNINMETIDNYLMRDDVAYFDMRMLFDPADYGSIGGEADLTKTIEGFKVVPYPYLATLQSLPVANAYQGDKLFEVIWGEDGSIVSCTPLYKESNMIIEEVFPKDKKIFLMCGGGGYANMTKQLLMYLGYDANKLYNIGANWEYKGKHALELVVFPDEYDGENIYATWRADYCYIDFSKLNPIE